MGTFIGHNSVRVAVMGRANRLATPDELKKMQALVEQAMRNGAVGFSTGLIYIPGTYSDTAEVVALATTAGAFGGVYASHMRNEGAQVFEAIEEAVTVGKAARVPWNSPTSRSITRAFGERAPSLSLSWSDSGLRASTSS